MSREERLLVCSKTAQRVRSGSGFLGSVVVQAAAVYDLFDLVRDGGVIVCWLFSKNQYQQNREVACRQESLQESMDRTAKNMESGNKKSVGGLNAIGGMLASI